MYIYVYVHNNTLINTWKQGPNQPGLASPAGQADRQAEEPQVNMWEEGKQARLAAIHHAMRVCMHVCTCKYKYIYIYVNRAYRSLYIYIYTHTLYVYGMHVQIAPIYTHKYRTTHLQMNRPQTRFGRAKTSRIAEQAGLPTHADTY